MYFWMSQVTNLDSLGLRFHLFGHAMDVVKKVQCVPTIHILVGHFSDFGAVCSRRFLWNVYQKIIIQNTYVALDIQKCMLEDFLKNLYTILNALFYTYFAQFLYNILHISLFIFCYCTICKLFCNSDPGEEYVLIMFIHLYYFILFVHKSETLNQESKEFESS